MVVSSRKTGLWNMASVILWKWRKQKWHAIQQLLHWLLHTIIEPPRDKTNKMPVRPAKTQISLGICPVWSESSLCAHWVAKDMSFLHADSEDSGGCPGWSQSSLGEQSFCWFCHEAAHMFCLFVFCCCFFVCFFLLLFYVVVVFVCSYYMS